ncbi:MAG: hypothetical protein ACI8Z0_002302, partial [Lentimonas sp.]
ALHSKIFNFNFNFNFKKMVVQPIEEQLIQLR